MLVAKMSCLSKNNYQHTGLCLTGMLQVYELEDWPEIR